MKKLFLSAPLSLMSPAAFALSIGLLSASLPSTASAQVVNITPSTTTCSGKLIATTATSLSLSTSTGFAFPVFVDVQNQDATNAIFCGDNKSVATTGGSGFEIVAGKDAAFTLPNSEQFYCIASVAAVQVSICRTQ